MWKKVSIIGGAFLLVLALVTSGFVIEDRYNNQKHHDKDLKTERSLTDKDLEGLENQVVMNLKQFGVEQKAQRKQNDTRYYLDQLDTFNRQIRDSERRLRANPNDQNAKDDLNYFTNERNKVRQKLDVLTRE
jgi:hypothetical protein